MKHINQTTLWLLGYLHHLDSLNPPRGLATTTPLPSDAAAGVGMATMRGLVKRGWAYEATGYWPSCSPSGIFYITEVGRREYAKYGPYERLLVSHTRLLQRVCDIVKRLRRGVMGDISPIMDEVFDAEYAIKEAEKIGSVAAPPTLENYSPAELDMRRLLKQLGIEEK